MAIDTCNVVGVWTDSAGVPRAATIEIVADSYFFDDTSNPDSIIFPSPILVNIPSTGVIDFDIPVSEPYGVSYTFKITPASVNSLPGGFIEFKASIPDALTVELASLMPTPYTQDRSVTGALRIAKEMLTNPAVQPYLVEGIGLIKQEATPAAPAVSNVLWVKPSLGLTFTWDSVNTKWESEIRWVTVGGGNVSASTQTFEAPIPNMFGSVQTELATVITRWSVGATPHDTGNRWSLQPQYKLASSATPVSVGSAILSTQGSYVIATVGEVTTSPATVLALNNAEFVRLTVTKTGSPNNLSASCTFGFRYYAV